MNIAKFSIKTQYNGKPVDAYCETDKYFIKVASDIYISIINADVNNIIIHHNDGEIFVTFADGKCITYDDEYDEFDCDHKKYDLPITTNDIKDILSEVFELLNTQIRVLDYRSVDLLEECWISNR